MDKKHMKKETKPGAMDDDAKKRAKDRKKKMEAQMNELFGDNNSGRYSGPIDK